MSKSILVCAIFMLSASCLAVVWFDDGGVHNIDYEVDDEIQVWDNEALPSATTVNFLTGFSSSFPIEVHLNSSINIYDGLFQGNLTVFDNSITTFEGGAFERNVMSGRMPDITSWDNSIITFEGGAFEGFISSNNYSKVFISTDSFAGAIGLWDNSYAEITESGVVVSVSVLDDSKAYISNGEITSLYTHGNAYAIVSGGSVSSITLYNYGVIIIHGTHFAINGEYVGIGEIKNTDFNNATLTCKLFNGDFLDTNFVFNSSDSSIILTSEAPDSPVYCLNKPSMDTNNDCKVDMIDFAEFALQWLSCGLSIQEACWQ